MSTFGTNTRAYLPTAFQFSYDGDIKDWGTTRLISINNVSNQADPINNKLRVSDLNANFYDGDGAIWTLLGNGTNAFNKDFSGTVFVGGSMGSVSDDLGVRTKKITETGAWINPFFSGKVTDVSKENDVVTIRAENLMNLLDKVTWHFPMNPFDPYVQGSFYKKYSFAVDKIDSTWDQLVERAGYNIKNLDSEMDLYAFPTVAGIKVGYGTDVTGIYDTSEGTGIEDTVIHPDVFMNTSFYQDFKSIKFKGTLFGTFRGTISKLESAKEHGWNTLLESEANVNTDDEGTFYIVNKMRFEWPSTAADESTPELYYQSLFTMEGDPTGILRHLLFGKMVDRYYTEAEHMGTDTFEEAAKVTGFKVYNQTINPQDINVLPYIQDLLNTESALFYVSTINQFNFEPYGPKNVQATLESIGTVDIFDSEYFNDINDTYNRIILNYGWNFETNEYSKKSEGTLGDWSITDDRVLDLSSKWVHNNNQANATIRRQLARYKFTSPKTNFTTNLKWAGVEIGDLYSVTSPKSGMINKTIQILDYTKGFGNGGKLSFSGYDGESLFLKKGYAQWEGDDDFEIVITGTSTSGWGTDIGSGTTLGINESLYGTNFAWW